MPSVLGRLKPQGLDPSSARAGEEVLDGTPSMLTSSSYPAGGSGRTQSFRPGSIAVAPDAALFARERVEEGALKGRSR